MFIDCKDEKDWLKERENFLTASDAGSYCGVNPYDTLAELHLWEEKTGTKKREDISTKPAVYFGKNAEEYLRNLFLLQHPGYKLKYDKFGLYVSDIYPFLAATLDGLLTNSNGELEILEIKTGTVRDGKGLRNWIDGIIPIQYYAQGCHQLICLNKAVAINFYALIQTAWEEEKTTSYLIYHRFKRDEMSEDFYFILSHAKKMWDMIQKKEPPKTKIKL